MRRIVLPLIAVAFVVAACSSGDDGLTSEEQELADALAAALEDEDDGFGAEPEDAQCIGDAVMEELGVEPFEEAGVTADDIGGEDSNTPGEVLGEGVVTDEQADAILDRWEDCVGDLSGFMAASASADEEFALDADGEECMAEGLNEDDLVRDVLRAFFTSAEEVPDDDAFTAFFVLINDCARADDGVGLFEKRFAENIAEDGMVTPEQGECIAAAIVEDMGEEAFLGFLSRGDAAAASEIADEFQRSYIGASEACGVPPGG